MIVRILGDAQYEVVDGASDRLVALDAAVDKALDAGDEAAFRSALNDLIAEVRSTGHPVDPTTILPSDLVLPDEDANLEEIQALLASEEVDS